MYIAVGKLHNARLASSTVCFSLLRLGKRQLSPSLDGPRVRWFIALPLVQGVLIAPSPSLLFRLFREAAESMAIVVSLPRAELGSTAKSVVYSGTHIYPHACLSCQWENGVRRCVAGHARTHVCIYRCTHAYTYTYACTLPKDSKRQMLKRPMETGHVDVAPDASHRTVAQHESL